ncbi:hypothetical protein DRW03_03450 [Corallococcus sp. H22C18031201]|nr:hypothetical protein DRW03_03450 [Corallococcus sp. H22C18031201]
MQKVLLTLCLSLGLAACGPQTPEEAQAPETAGATQSLTLPTGPTTCNMDGCPAGMCATSGAASSSCPGGYIFYCSTIVPGKTRCI